MSDWKELPGHLARALEAAARYRQQLAAQEEAAGQACQLFRRLIEDGTADPLEIRAAGDLAEELLGQPGGNVPHTASSMAGYLRIAANQRIAKVRAGGES